MASPVFVEGYQFMRVLLECNGVKIEDVKHWYSKTQGCGFLYHPDVCIVMFRPEEAHHYFTPVAIDERFQFKDVVIEHGKKKVEVVTHHITDSVWKWFRTMYPFVKRWIIVSSDVNSYMNTLLLESMWNTEWNFSLQHFKYHELGDPRLITDHKFQPTSVKVVPSNDKQKSFDKVEKHLFSDKQYRQILVYDILARFYGLKVGQVIECKGFQRQCGEQVDYLQVAYCYSIKGNKSKPSKLPEHLRKKEEAEEQEAPEEEEEEEQEEDSLSEEEEEEEEEEDEEQEQEETASEEEEEEEEDEEEDEGDSLSEEEEENEEDDEDD
jgi:hypothetical protein